MVRHCTNNTKSLHSPASHHYFPRLWYRYFECGGKRTSDKLHGNPDANSHFHPHFNLSPYSYAYKQFAAYMARLVSYYNKGSMTTETGQVITNPAGTNNRITYWEIGNEPDLSIETPCHPADWSAALTPKAYLTMWNAVVPQMRAVDPAIKLVGPTGGVNTGYTPDYIPTLMASSIYKPDVVSFHGYGGWDNPQGDLEIFDGGPVIICGKALYNEQP